LLCLSLAGAAPAAQAPASPWSSAAELEMLANERDSLRGVSRLAVAVNAPDAPGGTLSSATLRSTLVFRLGQAGLVVVQAREIEDPVLSVNVHLVANRNEQGAETGWLVYRVYADLLQLVRLPDHAGKARMTLASTWHAGSHGVAEVADAATLRERVMDVVNAFLDDHRAANAPLSPPQGPAAN
jgi:hypothetical protein